MDKQLNQIKYIKNAGYLDKKDQHKIKQIICFYLQKIRQKNNQQNRKSGL